MINRLPSDKHMAWVKDLKILPRVEVTWQDAATNPNWMSLADARGFSGVECHTRGYLIRRDKKFVAVAGSINSEGHVGDVTTIPRTWIVGIKKTS